MYETKITKYGQLPSDQYFTHNTITSSGQSCQLSSINQHFSTPHFYVNRDLMLDGDLCVVWTYATYFLVTKNCRPP